MRLVSTSSGVGTGGAGAPSLPFALLFATGAATFFVEASAKNGDDRHDVVGEVFFSDVCVVCFHDDFCTVCFEYELDKIEAESAEAIFVGNAHDA